MPDTTSVFAEGVSQGFYLNVEVNRTEAARYRLTVADVQRVITSEVGGADIAQNVEGRDRFPIRRSLPERFSLQPGCHCAGAHPNPFRRADSAEKCSH